MVNNMCIADVLSNPENFKYHAVKNNAIGIISIRAKHIDSNRGININGVDLEFFLDVATHTKYNGESLLEMLNK